MKIVVITDLHLNKEIPSDSERKGEIADILLLRTVHRINRFIKPDLVLLLGDLVDQPDSPEADRYYKQIVETLNILEAPYIAIPGNHDIVSDRFYTYFPKPNNQVDTNGVRFLIFLDPEEPNWNARRTDSDLLRMKSAREDGFKGPVVSIQHVPIFPPELEKYPYNYTNVNEILDIMKVADIKFAISGHYHPGFKLINTEHGSFLAVPALCETPFSFWEIDIPSKTPEDIKVVEHHHRLPEELELIDHHIHTHFAYCNENMDITWSIKLGQLLGAKEVRFSEHSAHLYFNKEDYGKGKFFIEGISAIDKAHCRMNDYLKCLYEAECSERCIGLEVDSDCKGNLVLCDKDRGEFSFLIGAVHQLRSLAKDKVKLSEVKEEFWEIHRRFLTNGIDILAHPFRIFRRSNLPIPEELFKPLVSLLKRHKVSAEVNFHTNEPPIEFFKLCIEAGVKLSLGSDAHNLYEVAELQPHLAFLSDCGVNFSDLKGVIR